MKLAAVRGVTPVSLVSVERTTEDLLDAMVRVRGEDARRDPGLRVAAVEAAELGHSYQAGLLALVEHPSADPAVLVAGVVPVERALDPASAEELRYHLADAGPGIREVTHAKTVHGHPVVIAERIALADPARLEPPTGAQLQAVVVDTTAPRIAVFTLHSPTGRGWLELAGVAGQLVATMRFG